MREDPKGYFKKIELILASLEQSGGVRGINE